MNWIRGILATSMICLGLVAVTPPAQADPPTWPVQTLLVDARYVDVVDDNAVFARDCDATSYGGSNGKPAFAFISPAGKKFSATNEGSGSASLPHLLSCYTVDKSDESQVVTENGTLYASAEFSSSGGDYKIVAEKNGRMLWQTQISACPTRSTYQWGYLTALTMGADGYLHGVLRGDFYNCELTYVVIDPSTGSVVNTPTSLGSMSGYGPAKVWTYSDKVMIITPSGELYYFENHDDGDDEITSHHHTFTAPSGKYIGNVWADGNERVHVVYQTFSCYGAMTVVSYDYTSGSSTPYTVPVNYSCSQSTDRYIAAPDDGLITMETSGNSIYLTSYDSTGDDTPVEVVLGTGTHYWDWSQVRVDEEGNALVFWTQYSTGWVPENVKVKSVDFGTETVTPEFDYHTDIGGSDTPQQFGNGDVFNNNLYLPICPNNCNGTNREDAWIHKIPLTDFGDEYGSMKTFLPPTAPEQLQYVAMGDSFSSGEGNPPFLYGTDVSSINMCHRSKDAYPLLLEADSDLNLDLRSFVACSGATTDNVLNGGSSTGAWGESPQVDALSADTDVATITIGGNDIKFSAFGRACVVSNCDSSSDEYQDSWDVMTDSNDPSYLPDALESVLEEIQDRLTSGNTTAKVVVAGYPYVVTYGSWNDPYSLNCLYMTGDSATAAMTIVDKLNEVIEDAVDDLQDSRFTFVDPTVLASPFWLHELCRDDNYFNGVQLGQPDVYTFHPNQGGHQAYEEMVHDALD